MSRAVIYLVLIVNAIAISSSQGIMKYTALVHREGAALTDWRFLLPLGVSFGISVIGQLVWLWALQFIPLGQGFMVLALTFVFVPLIGSQFFHEPLTPRFALGVVFVVAGILLTVRA